MTENEAKSVDKKVLLMLSGGRDSFLSACKLIGEGYHILTITYDNGHMSHADHVIELVERMQKRFGSEYIQTAGTHPIAQNIRPLLQKVMYDEPVKLCLEYPHLLINQANCLVCHTVMYLHSIAYCIAHNIEAISEGAREQQRFFVELPEMTTRYRQLCDRYNIELILPVYNLTSDLERKEELAEWGFLPKTYEPQCWMGCPMVQELTTEQRTDLAKYYDQEIEPHIDEIINRLVLKKKNKHFLATEDSYV